MTGEGTAPARLLVGTKAAGRGLERREVEIVMTPDGREIARYEYRRFGASLASAFTWGRDKAHATAAAELADDWEVVEQTGGTPPFRSTTHTVMRRGEAFFIAGSAAEAAAWKAGWHYALKEKGLLTSRGRLRPKG